MATAHAVRAARGRRQRCAWTPVTLVRRHDLAVWEANDIPRARPPAAQASSALRGVAPIIAAIEHPPVIARIVTHLDLPARAPPRSPTRLFYPQGAQQGRSLALAFDDAK